MVSDIDGLRYTTLLYGTGPGHSEPRALPLNTTSSAAAAADAVHASAVPRQWATHGGEDVPIWALGKTLICKKYYVTLLLPPTMTSHTSSRSRSGLWRKLYSKFHS